MGELLCLFGLHRWCVNVPDHALSVLKSGRVIAYCSRCDAWKQLNV